MNNFGGTLVRSSARGVDARLVILGAAGVGKSAIVVRYLTKRFIGEYDPTLECTYRRHTCVDDEPVLLEIVDTAGSNAYFDDNLSRQGDGFLIVYDITDEDSFTEAIRIKRTLDDSRRCGLGSISCVVVANKTDLSHIRQVTREQGEKAATENSTTYYELSASDSNPLVVQDVVHELYKNVRKNQTLEMRARRKSSAQQVKMAINKMFTKGSKTVKINTS